MEKTAFWWSPDLDKKDIAAATRFQVVVTFNKKTSGCSSEKTFAVESLWFKLVWYKQTTLLGVSSQDLKVGYLAHG